MHCAKAYLWPDLGVGCHEIPAVGAFLQQAQQGIHRQGPPAAVTFQHAFGQDEQWSEELLDRLVERQGEGSPASRRFVLNATDAPGVVHWLAHETLTLADLLRDPADRDQPLSLVPLILTRGARDQFVPSDDTVLQVGDEIVMAGHDGAMASLEQTLFHPSAVEYVATGRIVPSTWLFRRLSPRVQNV